MYTHAYVNIVHNIVSAIASSCAAVERLHFNYISSLNNF
jgi:hypothetical protein